MKKFQLSIIIIIISMVTIFAQEGSISEEQLTEIRSSFTLDSETSALLNAISNNKVSDIALNRAEVGKNDNYFKYKVEVSGITNQERSGRCWLFTSLNVIRPKVIEKYDLNSFEFSTNYLHFWDIFEKSNKFLENVIRTAEQDIYSREVAKLFSSPVGDGGAWNTFTNLQKKYGAVPMEAMPETYNSNHDSYYLKLLKRKLREDGLILREMVANKNSDKQIESKKIEMLKEVYRILALNLGIPPTEFQWRYINKDKKISEFKTYTPQSFWNEIVNIDVDEYIMFIDDPSREYYKLYEVEQDKNVVEGINWTYINLPAKELKPFALESIKNNDAMYFSCDVGKQLNKDEGILSVNNYDYESLYGIKFNMNKKQRMLSAESGSSHGMALVAVDTDKDEKITQWRLENSWGAKAGDSGYLTMTDEWFDAYMYRLVIHKKYISEKVLKILEQKPTKVPYYNPAFQFDK